MKNDYSKYEDIINLPHHVSKKHPQMSLEARSAQFAPFAALTGYDAAVKETARLTSERIEIGEDLKTIIDEKIQEIKRNLHLNIKQNVSITYFVPDVKKSGGKYVSKEGNVKKIDEYKQLIILEDKTEIPIEEIIEILDGNFSNIWKIRINVV